MQRYEEFLGYANYGTKIYKIPNIINCPTNLLIKATNLLLKATNLLLKAVYLRGQVDSLSLVSR